MIAERSFLLREMSSPSQRMWMEEQEGYSQLEKSYSAWLENVSHLEELFKKYVYENSDLTEADLRMHRFGLCSILTDGEQLAFRFFSFTGPGDKKSYIALIDQKLDALRNALFSWYGPIDSQKDIPDSFKRGIADIDAGRIVDLEKALSETPK